MKLSFASNWILYHIVSVILDTKQHWKNSTLKPNFSVLVHSRKQIFFVPLKQGRPTRGPRATSGPPKVLKWPAPKVSASVG